MNSQISYLKKVASCVDFFKKRWQACPDIMIILGTGQEDLPIGSKHLDSIPFSSIPYFPETTVESHSGTLIFGQLAGKNVVFLLGRLHYYEGYSLKEVTFPVRVLAELGCKTMIATNAAGGLNLEYKCGSLMAITDHLNFIGDNPLRGKNYDELGPRYPDMSEPYSSRLLQLVNRCAGNINLQIVNGVYVAIPGPSLETPAETKFYRNCGADAIGMSTVPEVIVARHAGLDVLAISIIANVNDPDNFKPIRVEDVIEQVKNAQSNCLSLLAEVIQNIS